MRFTEFIEFRYNYEAKGYSPGHPWYYHTGGKIFPESKILPYNPAQERVQNRFRSFVFSFWHKHQQRTRKYPASAPPINRIQFLEGVISYYKDEILIQDLPRYEYLAKTADVSCLQDCTGLSLKFNHITVALTAQARSESYSQKIIIPDEWQPPEGAYGESAGPS